MTKTATSETLRGVTLSRVDRKHLTKVVKSMKLNTDTSIDSMVVSLADHILRAHKYDSSKVLDCDFCGGPSDASFDNCPYCGLDEVASTAAAEKAKEGATAEQPVVEAQAPKKPRSAAKTAASVETSPSSDVGEAELMSTLTPPEEPAPLAVVHTPELVSTKDLDDKVAQIKQIQINIVDNHWQLGRLLGETWDLFKLRTDDKGNHKYKSWGQFVSAEIGISPAYAYGLMGVAKEFTEDDIRTVGVTKLLVLAKIPDAVKKKSVLARVKEELNNGKNTPSKQLEAEVRPGLEKSGTKKHQGRGAGGRPMKSKADLAPPKPVALTPSNPVGLSVFVQAKRTVVLLAANGAPARSLDDRPTAVETTMTGFSIHYRLHTREDGALVLEVQQVPDKVDDEPKATAVATKPAAPTATKKSEKDAAPNKQKPETQTTAAKGAA